MNYINTNTNRIKYLSVLILESKFEEEKLAPPAKDAKVNKWDGEDEEEVFVSIMFLFWWHKDMP